MSYLQYQVPFQNKQNVSPLNAPGVQRAGAPGSLATGMTGPLPGSGAFPGSQPGTSSYNYPSSQLPPSSMPNAQQSVNPYLQNNPELSSVVSALKRPNQEGQGG